VDFGSEKLRCLGNLRFDVCGAWKGICCPPSHKAQVQCRLMKVSWRRSNGQKASDQLTAGGDLKDPLIPQGERTSAELKPQVINNKLSEEMEHTITDNIYFMNLHAVPYMSIGINVAPELSIDGEYSPLTQPSSHDHHAQEEWLVQVHLLSAELRQWRVHKESEGPWCHP
jgi:hypothetical protein